MMSEPDKSGASLVSFEGSDAFLPLSGLHCYLLKNVEIGSFWSKSKTLGKPLWHSNAQLILFGRSEQENTSSEHCGET